MELYFFLFFFISSNLKCFRDLQMKFVGHFEHLILLIFRIEKLYVTLKWFQSRMLLVKRNPLPIPKTSNHQYFGFYTILHFPCYHRRSSILIDVVLLSSPVDSISYINKDLVNSSFCVLANRFIILHYIR